MPIYEYICDECGHTLEAMQKLSEAPLSTCPECRADSLRKKISAAGFRLKGGGWYETDFKSGNKKNVEASGESGSSGETGGKPADGGASEPAAAKGESSSNSSESTKKPASTSNSPAKTSDSSGNTPKSSSSND